MNLLKNMERDIELLSEKTFYVPAILETDESFDKTETYLYDVLKSGFEIKEVREAPVKFKFKLDGEVHTMQLRRFYVNLLMWYPLTTMKKSQDIDESYMVTDFSAKGREIYFNNQIISKYIETVDNSLINAAINDSIFKLEKIPLEFNVLLGASMNLRGFIKLAIENKEFMDLINTTIDPNEQPHNVERILNEKLRQLLVILKTHDNPLRSILLAGGNIKEKQLIEFFIAVGYKSTVDGKTLPTPISSNFLKGMNTISEYYIEANSAIKALLANFEKMGDAGFWQKNMMNLCSGIKLHPTIDDCNSVRPLTVEVKTKAHLEVLVGQYRLGYNGKLKVIKEDDTNLIGKKIRIKSPLTCGCKDGYICKKCYGDMYKINSKVGVGAFGTVKISEPVSQRVLETKHLNTTNSVLISFNETFNRICLLSSNEIYLLSNIEENINNLYIIIKKDDLNKLYADDTEMDANEYVTKFYLYNKKTDEINEIKEDHDNYLFLSPELKRCIRENTDWDMGDSYEIGIKNLIKYYNKIQSKNDEDSYDYDNDGSIRLFVMEIINNELTKPYYDIMQLLIWGNRRDENTLEWVYQRLLDLLLVSGINYRATYSQILLKPLVRKESSIIEYPDFNSYTSSQDYTITTINKALTANPSVTVGLSAPEIASQFTNIQTFKKTATGFTDPFFMQ